MRQERKGAVANSPDSSNGASTAISIDTEPSCSSSSPCRTPWSQVGFCTLRLTQGFQDLVLGFI